MERVLLLLALCACVTGAACSPTRAHPQDSTGPTVDVPQSAIAIKLSPQAESRLRSIGEGVKVIAYFDGDPWPGQGKYNPPMRDVYLGMDEKLVDSTSVAHANEKDCVPQNPNALACDTPDPQYTLEAAKANIKGTVVISATVGEEGCAHDIRVVRPLGYGLDEAAVFAVQRWRFRQRSKAMPIRIELNFDPLTSPRAPSTAPTCDEAVHRNTGR